MKSSSNISELESTSLSNNIKIISSDLPDSSLAFQDLKDCISKMNITSDKNFTIQLLIDENFYNQSDKEVSQIQINKEVIKIISFNQIGLERGVYHFLNILGIRWLLPGEAHWLEIPDRINVPINLDSIIRPKFQYRQLTGSFGYGNKKLKQSTFAKNYRNWFRRVGYGKSLNIAFGHYGSKFNKKYISQLKSNAHFRPLINGKRSPYKYSIKPSYAEPEVVQLFVQDAKDRLNEIYKNKSREERVYISLEPADSKKHCSCNLCVDKGTHSDALFYMVNEVAKAIKEDYPNAHISLLAYSDHTKAPELPLEDNVHISISAYHFQREGSPEMVIKEWSTKASSRGLKYHLALPEWNLDKPVYKPSRFVDILEHASMNGLVSFSCQSSYSPIGLGYTQYILNDYMWNNNFNLEQIQNRFLQDAFHDVAYIMKDLFEQFQLNSNLKSLTPVMFDLLNKASTKTENEKVLQRILDFKAYAIYLVHLQKVLQSPQDKSHRELLLNYIWSIYPKGIIHSFGLTRSLERKFDFKTNIPSLISIPEISDLKLENEFQTIYKKLKVNEVELHKLYNKKYTKYIPRTIQNTFQRSASNNTPFYEFGKRKFFMLYSDGQSLELKLNIKKVKKEPLIHLTVRNPEGVFIEDKEIQSTLGSQSIALNLNQGFYLIDLRVDQAIVQLQSPKLPFAIKGSVPRKITRQPKKYYFNVPTNSSTLQIEIPPKSGFVSIYAGSILKKKIEIEESKQEIFIDINSTDINEVWSIETKRSDFKILNFPSLISLTKEKTIQLSN